MCLGAIYWSRINKIYYANTIKDTQAIWFDDVKFFEDFKKPNEERMIPSEQLCYDEAKKVFDEWKEKVTDIKY